MISGPFSGVVPAIIGFKPLLNRYAGGWSKYMQV
jgi:hypothetical protein